jgi:hypothetical protein
MGFMGGSLVGVGGRRIWIEGGEPLVNAMAVAAPRAVALAFKIAAQTGSMQLWVVGDQSHPARRGGAAVFAQ